MKGYVILAKQRGELCKADALKLRMESEWKRIYSSDAVSWIQKPHKVLMAVYEQEMLFLLAQGYEENGENMLPEKSEASDDEGTLYSPVPCQ